MRNDINIGNIFCLKKGIIRPGYQLDIGDLMVCVDTYHENRILVSKDEYQNDHRAQFRFIAQKYTSNYLENEMYFWDYFETKQERRKRIIKDL